MAIHVIEAGQPYGKKLAEDKHHAEALSPSYFPVFNKRKDNNRRLQNKQNK